MKIPPADAYLKIKHTLEEINGVIIKCAEGQSNLESLTVRLRVEIVNFKISPQLGNVAFASSRYGACFTL